ncbi:MAG: protein kinase, partial [Thermoanaerobaculia bacterium]|nr:protein kinase [Thermoanaerobaculia bacterium]
NRGHGVGTLPYMAPEQLDPSEPLDERVDVYALGVVLFELLCGETPWPEGDDEEVVAAIREGRPRLAIEIDQSVPEPLQAVALKAMERDPDERYPSPAEMARDLRRFLDGKPVLARPTAYTEALEERIRPHLAALREWLGLDLIYPHEEKRLRREYDRLTTREDDWIVESRVLSWSQIALYLGAFFLVAGGLLYFWAHRVEGAVEGILHPALVQGLPFLGLTVAAWFLRRRGHPAVSVAFDLAATVLLPFFLLILLHELGLWDVAGGKAQLFPEGTVTDRQLQVSFLVASLWASLGAWRTRTVALGATAATLWSLFGVVVLADLGLRTWWTEGQWDRLALHLAPIALLEGLAARGLHRRDRIGFGRSLAVAAALVGGFALELLALDGRMFEILGITLAGVEAGQGDPVLLDTLVALSLNGLLFYAGATALERWGDRVARPAAVLLAVVSPFALLEPLFWLVSTDTFSRRWDWIYLALAVGVALLSRHRQRKSFYLAGLLNTGTALLLITLHQEWLDDPPWSLAVIVAGLAVLAAGFGLSVLERRKSRRPG